jgi:DNA-binding NtrC family response regulator
MSKILVVDSSARDAERFQVVLSGDAVDVEVCASGAEGDSVINERLHEFAATVVLWEIPGPPFGFDLLARCRQLRPTMPVVVASGTLDAALAARALALGARDFLEKPLDSERVRSCIASLLAAEDPLSPLVVKLRQTIAGESTVLLEALKELAKAIPHIQSKILLVGESGTGKELFARAVHGLGARSAEPWVAVNVSEIPRELIESALFGHEKGAFTGAVDRYVGFLERAGRGTLFLDEIGDLELSLQVKLLRSIQELEFRRIKGANPLPFHARLVCATNRDLTAAVSQGMFRRDLFHRIAEVTIQIPPLRERLGDIDVLLDRFLEAYGIGRQVRFARETLTILRTYPYPGNVRELENLVKASLIACEGDVILPKHLPWPTMASVVPLAVDSSERWGSHAIQGSDQGSGEIVKEIARLLPANWLDLPYREATMPYTRAFDRVYLRSKLERCRYNVTRAAREAGIDTKTFRSHWEDCGLPPLNSREENSDG